MSQLTRREFLATPSILAVPLVFAGATQVPRRDLLASAWPAATAGGRLIPRDSFHPFPKASARAHWEALPAVIARAALLGEQVSGN